MHRLAWDLVTIPYFLPLLPPSSAPGARCIQPVQKSACTSYNSGASLFRDRLVPTNWACRPGRSPDGALPAQRQRGTRQRRNALIVQICARGQRLARPQGADGSCAVYPSRAHPVHINTHPPHAGCRCRTALERHVARAQSERRPICCALQSNTAPSPDGDASAVPGRGSRELARGRRVAAIDAC